MLNPRPLVARLVRHWKNDRGAAIVEAALAIPILLLVIMGSIEFGFAWEAKSANTSGVRTGVLRAASIGDKPETDMRIIQSVIGEVGTDRLANLEWIMIFNGASNADDQTTIDACAAAIAGGGIVDQCVVYTPGTLQAVLSASDPDLYQTTNFDDGGGAFVNGAGNDDYACQTALLDTNWCAARRTVNGDAEVGIAVQYKHAWFTGIFPSANAPTFQDSSVSSTFLEEGSSITPTNVYSGPGTTTSYDSGSFDGPLNVGDVTWTGVSDSDISGVPADPNRKFLGPMAMGDVATVTIDNLDAHVMVCASFDLYIIGSWDGPGTYGPDMFRVDIGSDGTYEHNHNYVDGQTTGASEVDTMDFDTVTTGGWGDMVFPLTVCGSHTGTSVSVEFSSVLTNGDWQNESWGIDNLEIEIS